MKVSYKSKSLSPLLKLAIKAGILDSVRLQIERGSSVNAIDSAGLTPLMLAAIYSQEEVCLFLLSAGADVSLKDAKGKTAGDYAADNGFMKVSQLVPSISVTSSFSELLKNKDRTQENSTINSSISIKPIELSTEKNSAPALTNQIEIVLPQTEEQSSIIYKNFEVSSPTVSYEILYIDEGEFDIGGWLAEDEVTIPENDLSCVSNAEVINKTLSNHRPNDTDTDWSDIEITLPQIVRPRLLFTQELTNLHQLMIMGAAKGVVGYGQIINAIEGDIDETMSELALPLVLNALGDLGIFVEEYEVESNAHSFELSLSIEDEIAETLQTLHHELSNDLNPHQIYINEINEFDLIDKAEEERIGRRMSIALIYLARNLANLSEVNWQQVSDIFSIPDVEVEENALADENAIVLSEMTDKIVPKSKEIDMLPQVSSFWELVKSHRVNSDVRIEDQHIPRPSSQNLTRLIGKISRFTNDEDVMGILSSIDSYRKAQHKLTHVNFRLVNGEAKRYFYSGLPLEDLIQEGNLGLMKAVELFDYQRGYKFSTYAMWWIKQAMTRAIADKVRLIRLPVHMVEVVNSVERARRELERNNKLITIDSLAQKSERTREQVIKATKANQSLIFFDDLEYELCCGESNLDDFVSDLPSPDQWTFDCDLKDTILEMLSELTPREAKVLKMRFGIDMPTDYTLEEVGRQFDLTRERVRQIEVKAMMKLKHPTRIEKLKTLID